MRALGASLGLLLLCSCASEPHSSGAVTGGLPADTLINEAAGRGGHLMIPLRLADGRELFFMVDTGAPVTLCDQSLASHFGKKKRTEAFSFVGGRQEVADVYSAPKLYCGNTRLMTGREVATVDFKKLPFLKNPAIVGILGMDCLRHYCLQLDFQAGKIRFLPPRLGKISDLGLALPLTYNPAWCPQIREANFIGPATNVMIDSGCNVDGMVDQSMINGIAVFFPERNWDGETYTNLIVAAVGHANALGLRFLARHMVTFDFPNRVLYLKKMNAGPLLGDHSLHGSHFGDLQSPLDLLLELKAKNQLPDCSKDQPSQICFETCSNSLAGVAHAVTFSIPGSRGSILNHYETAMDATGSQWKLRRAWQTDGVGKTTEKFPVP